MKLEVSEGGVRNGNDVIQLKLERTALTSENSPGWVEQELSDIAGLTVAGNSGGVAAKAVTSCLIGDLSDGRS